MLNQMATYGDLEMAGHGSDSSVRGHIKCVSVSTLGVESVTPDQAGGAN